MCAALAITGTDEPHMPKLGKYRFVLDNVAFVYQTRELALKGRKAGGTGFFVAVPSERAPDALHHIYLVTNVHVAQDKTRTIRVNTRDGKVDLLTIDKWVSSSAGPDVAVAPVALDAKRHAVEALRSDSWLLTKEEFAQLEIDSGDDVFMVGRFIDYDGEETNRPSVRFGHISMREANIVQKATGYSGASLVIDMHSRSGYSGSPVFVYRTGGSIFAQPGTLVGGGHLMKLLGIHWGQFPESWELSQAAAASKTEDEREAQLVTDGRYVTGLSGMTCVVPAWDILALLGSPELVELRKQDERAILG